MCTSGGRWVTARSHLASVIQVGERDVLGTEGHDGRVAQMWDNCSGGFQIFAAVFVAR